MPWRKEHRDPAYGSAAWRKARAEQLARDRGRCTVRGPGCLGAATEVDHIYGLAADPQHRHLRSVCSVCHKALTSTQSSRGHREPPAQPRTRW